jgi:hypothetical protein
VAAILQLQGHAFLPCLLLPLLLHLVVLLLFQLPGGRLHLLALQQHLLLPCLKLPPLLVALHLQALPKLLLVLAGRVLLQALLLLCPLLLPALLRLQGSCLLLLLQLPWVAVPGPGRQFSSRTRGT